MQPLSETDIKKKLKAAFWDITATEDELYDLLRNKRDTVFSVDKTNLFTRLLNTYDWYVILGIIPFSELSLALNDKVLNKLWPKNLRKRYLYARRILFEETLPLAG